MNIESSPTLSARAQSWNAAMVANPGALDLHIEASRIEGVIPHSLRGGRVLSNGPGWTKFNDRIAHPFDGHGYVRAFEFRPDGSLRLRARFVQTRVYRDEAAANRLVHRGLGTNPSEHFWNNLRFGVARNVANTTIVPWAGKLLAGWEGGAPHAVDPDSLETKGEETFGGALSTKSSTLAHTRHDVARNRLVFCSPRIGPKTKVTFREVDAQGVVVETREAEVPGPLFAHDFAITPNWYVLAGNRLKVKFGELAKTLLGASTFIRCLETNDDVPGVVHLIPRGRSGPVRSVTLPGQAFVIHYGNAFERDGAVHVDASLFSQFSFGSEFGYRGPFEALDPTVSDRREPQRLYRCSLSNDSTEGKWEQLTSYAVDFPRIHPAHDGLDTQLLFGATRADSRFSDPFDSLIGLDLWDLERPPQLWTSAQDTFVGEPLFVPSPERPEAGWVVAMTSDGLSQRSTLGVFDANALAAGPVARIQLPLLPYAFHGQWDAGRA